MKIKFCGASKTVTGSCYLLEACGKKFLVDCGMFQGKESDLNYKPFPFNASEIDFVLLTHAHIDHSGRIPILYKNGFKGSVYCTSATAELVDIMLKDSGHIQEKDAEWENKKRLRKGLEAISPLYTYEDARIVSQYIYPVSYNKSVFIDENISFTMKDAGHLLGSAIIVIQINDKGEKKKITFTGDLGNFNIPIIKDYEYIDETDYLVIESTYGDKMHEIKEESESLYEIIERTTKRGGNVIIPSFAIGRTQELLYILNYYIDIEKKKELEDINIYMDSPLAIDATSIFGKHLECYDEEALKTLIKDRSPLTFDNLNIVKTAQESQELNNKNGIVIISSSGMCEAGRIKHHLKHNLWRKDSSIVFVGYQAEGTLGREILNGKKSIKIFGERIIVQAEICSIQSLSGHADLNGLLNWVNNIKNGVNKKIFITHGDIDASENFKNKVSQISNTEVIIPNLFDEFKI